MTKKFLTENPDGGSKFQERTPMRRIVDMQEVVNTILFLLSDAVDMINGQNIVIDGGYTAC
jgi:NAD(P)-dependent dehydrogenase (short-subunit alcohol dehydrogenase family)